MFLLQGGGQLWQTTSLTDASHFTNGSLGGCGSIGARYAWYKDLNQSLELGFMTGIGAGYGTYLSQVTNHGTFVNTDYYENQIEYSTEASFKQVEQFWKADVSLLFAFRYKGFVFQLGPHFFCPIATKRQLTISQANINAYYPKYGVLVTDELITGQLTCPYQQSERTAPYWYTLSFDLEAGWEWKLNGGSCIGLQAYLDLGPTFTFSKNQQEIPMITVSPINDTSNPIPNVTVEWADRLVGKRMHLGFGIQVYYTLPIGTGKSNTAE